MAGGRKKKIKTINSSKENNYTTEYSSTNDVIDVSARKRLVDMKKIDSSIITTKRLTVGIKGIFGNARSSNSVYRDIQERLESRKMSRDVTSEIEHNLSRILPNRKKCHDARYQTPRETCTTSSSKAIDIRSSVSSSTATPSTCSSSCSSATPTFVQDELSRVANDIVTSIPSLKILKDYHLLESIRKDLYKINQDKHTLKIIPKYERVDEYPDEAPAIKKHCGEEQNSLPQDTVESQEDEKTQSTQNVNIGNEEKISRVQPPVEAMDHEPINPTIFHNQNSFNPFAMNYFTETDNHQPMLNIEQKRDSLPSAPKHNEILSQPISSLRCNRRLSSKNSNLNKLYEPSSDLLDYIDNLPFQALENRLLGRNTQNIGPENDSAREPLKMHHVTELEKPCLDSPSPPKLYRMNMF